MPFAEFTRVREVSSEDKAHEAENLIGIKAGKKWRTKSNGEKSAYVILELSANQQICGIDIGNEHSAFVEVLVSKGSCDPKDFTEILVTCSFMTPIESKNSTNPHRVRCFNTEALVPEVASEKWSLVKIVCTQPFNKHVQYGLSFIKLHVVENKCEKKENCLKVSMQINPCDKDVTTKQSNVVVTTPKQIGKFNLRRDSLNSDESNDSTLFKRWQKCKNSEDSIVKLSPGLSLKQSNSNHIPKAEIEVPSKKPRLSSNGFSPRQKTQINHSKLSDAQHTKSENDCSSNVNQTSGHAECSKQKVVKPNNMKTKVNPKILNYKPFHQLFQGVVFVFSGIQNPERAELRNKALALGGKYKPDWDPTCTHLVCAFKNTPKHNQVKGKGKIVLPKWITECYNAKKYLPWRRFALDASESNKIESDEEILDESLKPSTCEKNSKKDLDNASEVRKNENKSDILSLYDLDDSYDTNEQQSNKQDICITDSERGDVDCNEIQQTESMNVYDASTDEEDYLKEKMEICA